MNRPPPIMEPEDEIRALRQEVSKLRNMLLRLEPTVEALDGTSVANEALVDEFRAALNPAKSAAPFSPG